MKLKILTALLALGLLLGVSWVAFATNGIKNSFNTFYANKGIVTTGSAIDQCILCHAQNPGQDFPSLETPPNPYGVILENNGRNFTAAESLDSDGDGFTNIAEIIARTFPGNPTSKPTLPTSGDIVDFNADGKTDILWQHATSGTAAIWFMNGASISSVGVPGAVSGDWQIMNK